MQGSFQPHRSDAYAGVSYANNNNEGARMLQSWLLNVLNFLFPTLAVLLLLLAQMNITRVTGSLGPGEVKAVFRRHHKRLNIAIALLAAWLILQYAPLVYP
jgi:hypothetical protein